MYLEYVSRLRELLEQLAEVKTPEGLPRISKAKLTEYSEKIEALAAKLATPMADVQVTQDPITGTFTSEDPSKTDGERSHHSSRLRKRSVPPLNAKEGSQGTVETDQTVPVKLDATAQTHIVQHRKLQGDLADEMVVLARQLKESTLMMSQSIQNTEKVLDSTEKASIAGQAPVMLVHELWRYTTLVPRLHASRGLRFL